MSDKANAVQDYCVCLKPVKNRVVTPCSHTEPLCESCYQKIPSCPLCRTSFDNGVSSLEFSDDDSLIDQANDIMLAAAEEGDERLVRQMLDQGVDVYDGTLVYTALNNHLDRMITS